VVDFPIKAFHKKEMLSKLWDDLEIPTSLLDITGFCEYDDSLRRNPLCECSSCKTHYELFDSSNSYRELYDNYKYKKNYIRDIANIIDTIKNNK
ncbi:MAG: hypothetical protein ACRCXT_07370, partial [Paraclostridium sp.]